MASSIQEELNIQLIVTNLRKVQSFVTAVKEKNCIVSHNELLGETHTLPFKSNMGVPGTREYFFRTMSCRVTWLYYSDPKYLWTCCGSESKDEHVHAVALRKIGIENNSNAPDYDQTKPKLE